MAEVTGRGHEMAADNKRSSASVGIRAARDSARAKATRRRLPYRRGMAIRACFLEHGQNQNTGTFSSSTQFR